MAAGDLAHRLEVARLGEDDPEVHHRRLHDQAGRLAPFGVQPLDPPFERVRVVERHGDRQVDDGLRDSGSVGKRVRRVVRADRGVLDADRDHHRVVMAVVRAEDLEHDVAAGERARDPDRVHRRLRPRVRVPPRRQAEAPRELLGDDDRVLRRRREVRPQRDPLADGGNDRRVRVPLDHRAEAVVEVEVAVAVDVPDLAALAPGQVDRPRIAGLVGRRDAA